MGEGRDDTVSTARRQGRVLFRSAWSEHSRRTREALRARYGPPHETAASLVIWHNNGPWKQTILHRSGELHNFPKRHRDTLQQTVDFLLPLQRLPELLAFNGSLRYDRTRGELSAFCDSEAANLLVLNFASDVVQGRLTVADARKHYAAAWRRMRLGWPQPAAQGLLFAADARVWDIPAADPDRGVYF